MTTQVPTYCRICEATCGLTVELDDRARPVAIRPDKQHPVSKGFACAKGTRILEVAQHRDRLLAPQRRRPEGALERTRGSEARAFASERLKPILERHGPHAIGVYYGNPLAFN